MSSLDQSTINRVAPLCPQCAKPLMYIQATDFTGWVCMITPCCSFHIASINPDPIAGTRTSINNAIRGTTQPLIS
jgi:ssDNA-binding Zn-finger/Zn-ribbon topoisomerase 1